MIHRRKRNTGTIRFRDGHWIGYAPRHTRGAKQVRVANGKTRRETEVALEAWLRRSGRIVRKESHV